MNSKLIAVALTVSIAAVSGWMTYAVITAPTNRGLGRFGCEMHCEPGKTYASAAVCEVCNMRLRPVAELPFGVAVTTTPSPVVAGAPTRFTVRALDQTGMPLRYLQGPRSRGSEQMHVFVVSEDFEFFHHETPTRAAEGTFASSLALPHAGRYTLWAEFLPAGRVETAAGSWAFRAEADQPSAAVPPAPPLPSSDPIKISPSTMRDTTDEVISVDGFDVRLRCNGQKARAGVRTLIRVGVQRAGTVGGVPSTANATLQLSQSGVEVPRISLFSADGRHLVHHVPIVPGTADTDAALVAAAAFGNGLASDSIFAITFPAPGFYRGFLQFAPGLAEDEVAPVIAPFWITVEPGDATSPGSATPTGEHNHEAHSQQHGAGTRIDAGGGAGERG